MANKRVPNAVLGYNLKNDRMISVYFQGMSLYEDHNKSHSPEGKQGPKLLVLSLDYKTSGSHVLLTLVLAPRLPYLPLGLSHHGQVQQTFLLSDGGI